MFGGTHPLPAARTPARVKNREQECERMSIRQWMTGRVRGGPVQSAHSHYAFVDLGILDADAVGVCNRR